MHYSVEALISNINYKILLTAGSNSLTADEPAELGGGNTGPSPSELLCMSLASCTCATLKMYANRKQWNTGDIKVQVTLERKDDGAHFTRHISFDENISTEMKERLLSVAEKCPIHKTLMNPVFIETAAEDFK